MIYQAVLPAEVEGYEKTCDFCGSTRKPEHLWLSAFLYYRDAIAPLYGERSRRQAPYKGSVQRPSVVLVVLSNYSATTQRLVRKTTPRGFAQVVNS